MEQSKFIKKLAIWVAIVGAVVALVIGLCFGKQIETTLFGEISKWIVMSAAVIGIVGDSARDLADVICALGCRCG